MIEPATTDEIELRMTRSELEVVRSALRMLQWTLGRDEADELEAVKAVLLRLETEHRTVRPASDPGRLAPQPVDPAG